ncbi:MAG: transporter [Desulfuromonadales bacterium GWD2_61_12]|nr:MAG: transporter [Desulfuromonadales bacterium GWC2_61_20]OGR35587.1 MAG: transporter [Desulfuromonadales bacterium GWD2_61_12]HAD03323.1 transporter [Desulfuromonas sp.]HBT82773.1 transporter [Desulfuromonas sp.]
MRDAERIVAAVAAALERETLVNLHEFPLQLEIDTGVLTMEGEVEHIMAKKRALEVAAAIHGVSGIVDRLRLVPARPMGDGEIRDHICRALLAETLLGGCTIRAIVKEQPEVLRAATQPEDGRIDVEVREGIVVLDGAVSSLSAKRLAGVFAWWVPGSRDVINGIDTATADDNDDEVVDALRLVLEKDPFVDPSRIHVGCRNCWITLDGVVQSAAERHAAEADAWFVFRVDGVTNRLLVKE